MPEMPRREVQSFSSLVMLMRLPQFWGYGRERCRGVIVSVRRPIRMAITCESASRPTEQRTSSRLAEVLEVATWCRAASRWSAHEPYQRQTLHHRESLTASPTLQAARQTSTTVLAAESQALRHQDQETNSPDERVSEHIGERACRHDRSKLELPGKLLSRP